MNLERLAQEYVAEKKHLEALGKRVDQIKEMIKDQVARDGTPDEKGHVWLQAGRYILQNQRRQGEPFLDRQAAEAWARDLDIFDEVKVVTEAIDADALAGWVYLHKDEVNPETGVLYETEYRELFVTPDPSYGFQLPKESSEQYNDY